MLVCMCMYGVYVHVRIRKVLSKTTQKCMFFFISVHIGQRQQQYQNTIFFFKKSKEK